MHVVYVGMSLFRLMSHRDLSQYPSKVLAQPTIFPLQTQTDLYMGIKMRQKMIRHVLDPNQTAENAAEDEAPSLTKQPVVLP